MNLLAPYRVLDLTDERGPLAGMMLAALGADVIRVEPPAGSGARRAVPLLAEGPESERSLAFAAYDRGKRSLVLDLGSEPDRTRLLDLVAGADFVLDSGPLRCSMPRASASSGCARRTRCSSTSA